MKANLNIVSKALGQPDTVSNSITNTKVSFGLPECLLDLANGDLLDLLPTNSITELLAKIQSAQSTAVAKISQIKRQTLLNTGLYVDENNNSYVFKSIYSYQKPSYGLSDFTKVLTLVTNEKIYKNKPDANEKIEKNRSLISEVNQYETFITGAESEKAKLSPNYIDQKYASQIAQINSINTFLKRTNQALEKIEFTLYNRSINPDLEPVFIGEEFSNFGLVDESATAQSTADIDPIFRLVFGPPKSKSGQFLLSVDGLYYDSQKGGLPEVSGFIPSGKEHTFEFDPNLGGKGVMVSMRNFSDLIDTIFDPKKINTSQNLLDHYRADKLITTLEGQRDKQVNDLNKKIQDSILEGEVEDSAYVINLKQEILSTIGLYEKKINKRKKQIEIAITAPYLYGKQPKFNFGEVPVNDFTHLANLNLPVSLEKQKRLTFKSGDVNGVVLPIKPRFVKAQESANVKLGNRFTIPPVSPAAIVYGDVPTSSTQTTLSLTDSIPTDGLVSIYNLLQGDTVLPGSRDFKILNSNPKYYNTSSPEIYNNAQLVGISPSSVYNLGLGIPYLKGITSLDASGNLSGIGSYIRLPDTSEYRDLAYRKTGFTFECWAYVPNVLSVSSTVDPTFGYGVSSYHRLLLACENNAGNPSSVFEDDEAVASEVVKGLVIGFTRDRQITLNQEPSDNSADNPVANSVFYVAPTISTDTSNVSFTNYTGCPAGSFEVLKAAVPVSAAIGATGKYLSSVANQFMHFVVSLNLNEDSLKIFVDGVEMYNQVFSQTFYLERGTSFRCPSFVTPDSFNYSLSSTGSLYFANGPTAPKFTPWIVGGGFTDGNRVFNSGFMGPGHGLTSGLKGYVGSIKFYSRPLSTDEVSTNYNTQKGFFKNIDLT
jgi:hypothetical protein